jgi:hypothetical protein
LKIVRIVASGLRSLDGTLQAHLHRLDCPTTDELGEYHQEMLTKAQSIDITSHLELCLHCSREIMELDAFLLKSEADISISAASRIQTIVAELISSSRSGFSLADSAFAPAISGIRGVAEQPFIYQADDIRVSLDISLDPDHPSKKMVLGLVTGVDTQTLSANLLREDEIMASSNVDDSGNLVITNLESGIYDIHLLGKDNRIEILSIEI